VKKSVVLCVFLFLCFSLCAQTEEIDINILGWSARGHLAYCFYHDSLDPLGPCTDFRFIIQDLVTDEIVFEIKYFSEKELLTFAEVYALHKKEISAKYGQFGIVESESVIKAFPLQLADEMYELEISAEYYQDDIIYPLFDIEPLSLLVVNLVSDARGTKEIYSLRRNSSVISYSAFYCQSPFEPRIALIVVLGAPGWEGTPLEYSYAVIGCHLKVGFAKD
jgi:hypothetical protein